MIYLFDKDVETFVVDVGRPSFLSNESCEWWQKFFNYVETTNLKIQVNSLYNEMRKYAFENNRYLGGGFSFCFWFSSKDDRKEFVQYINNELGAKYSHDSKNKFLMTKNDKVCLICSEIYAEKTKQLNSFLVIKPHSFEDFQGNIISYEGFYEVNGSLHDIIELKFLLDEYSLEL
jgi:hypothetical protein